MPRGLGQGGVGGPSQWRRVRSTSPTSTPPTIRKRPPSVEFKGTPQGGLMSSKGRWHRRSTLLACPGGVPNTAPAEAPAVSLTAFSHRSHAKHGGRCVRRSSERYKVATDEVPYTCRSRLPGASH